MPTDTGFASDHTDLLDKLKIFALANGATSLRYDTSISGNEELILQLPGSGSDEIIFGMRCYSFVAEDRYGWELQGMTGFNNTLSFHEMPGTIALSTNPPCLPLHKNTPSDSNTIKYWFVMNTRRIIIVAKIGSTYQSNYMGFILPYGIPTQWPYPLMVGGSTNRVTNIFAPDFGIPLRFSDTTWQTAAYWYNRVDDNAIGTACLREPGGVYLRFRNQSQSSDGEHNSGWTGTWPYTERFNDFGGDAYQGFDNMRTTLDGSYTLQPIMYINGSTDNVYGELDGVKHVSGFGNAPENTITVGTDDWLVIPNITRNGTGEISAVKLV